MEYYIEVWKSITGHVYSSRGELHNLHHALKSTKIQGGKTIVIFKIKENEPTNTPLLN